MIETNFKHTEIGLIPHDWEVKSLGEIGYLQNGYAYNSHTFGDIGYTVIRISDIKDGNVVLSDAIKSIVKAPDSFIVKKGNFLIAMSGATTGKVGLYAYEKSAYINQRVGNVICMDADSGYVRYSFNSVCFSEYLTSIITAGAQPNISKKQIEEFAFPLPPTLAEQERIAGALSSIDTLIGALNEQIEKKRHIKQGTMQQLLTGKKRLAGFTGEWKEVWLGELGYVIRGVGFKPEQVSVIYKKGYICLLRSNNVDKACINYDNVIFVDSVCVNDNQIMRREDILLCAANGSRNLVGKAGRKIDDKLNTFGAFMCVFRCEDIKSAPFISFLLQSSSYLKQLDEILAGSAINNLNAKQFGNMSFSIPPTIAEQSAIAAVLSGMDTEIAALEQKRDKYIAIKSGMMQDLLTGKIRLV